MLFRSGWTGRLTPGSGAPDRNRGRARQARDEEHERDDEQDHEHERREAPRIGDVNAHAHLLALESASRVRCRQAHDDEVPSRFFDVAYEGRPTWDIGRPQGAVVRLAERGRIVGSVLDLGCGTGEHALYLAERGHEVLGIDLAPGAIDRARAKARERGLAVTFLVWDALRADELGRAFDTALDVGLFHSLAEGDRAPYARSLHGALAPGGRAFVLCWSDRNPWGFGPLRISRRELRETFAGPFEIRTIAEEALESLLPDAPVRAWLAHLVRA